jgi:hypothetical protein
MYFGLDQELPESKSSISREILYQHPFYKINPDSHSVFVTDLQTAKQLLAKNIKFSAPCAFGIDCRLHLRPTLREKTDGPWLHEGEDTIAVIDQHTDPTNDFLQTEDGQSTDNEVSAKNQPRLLHLAESSRSTASKTASQLDQNEAAIRQQIARLEKKYGTDLAT